MKSPYNEIGILLSNTFFYTIPFEEERMRITRDMLNKHYENIPKGNRIYSDARSKFLSYEHELFTVLVQLTKDIDHKLYLHIESEQLMVACSCGMPGEKLCKHAYLCLHSLAWQSAGLNLFRLFYPGVNTKLKNDYKFLNVKLSSSEAYIDPKPEFGLIYRPGLAFNGQPKLDFEAKPIAKASVLAGSQEVFGYAIVFSTGEYVKAHLPFLMPFTATTNKAGTDIAFYKQFIKRGKIPGKVLTNDEIILNEIAYDMLDTVIGIGKLEVSKEFKIWEKVIPSMLNQWRMGITKLKDQQYVCAYEAYGFKRWFDKPARNTTKECSISADALSVTFLLKEQEDHYSLTPIIKANGKELVLGLAKYPLFVVDTVSNHFYLVGSLPEEQLLNWLHFNHNKLTVMKSHFQEFKETFLNRLSIGYNIMFCAYRSKKRIQYHMEDNG